MPTVAENNKRIAKNTIFLYTRMFLTLIVGLYTSRIILQALGINDYGINSVVGGIVILLAYINNLLSQGTSRFLTIALGEEDYIKLKNIFSACVTMHIIVAVITLILGETVGLWFVNNELNIDSSRIYAANWVYQLSLTSCILSIMQVPYNASVISHEKMSIFAYFSIFEVLMKLIAAWLLLHVTMDKLILLSTFNFTISCLTIIFYRIYCIKKFTECTFKLGYDKKLYKEIATYTGWNSLGTFAFTVNNQGINVLLNIFFGTTVNAARGITNTVSNMITQFINGFQTAVRPQITKYYAQGNIYEMNKLIINDSQYSSYLVLLIGIPLFFETEYIIHLWLGQTPQYVVIFIRLTIIQLFIQAIDFPIGAGIHAYGKMKLPNLTSTMAYLSILPLSYIAMKLDANPEFAYFITIIAFTIAMGFDLWILNKYSKFNIRLFLLNVVIKNIVIITFPSIVLYIIHLYIAPSFIRFISTCFISIVFLSILIFCIGFDKKMQLKIISVIKNKFKSIKQTHND